jgi:hypothetical protein
MKLDSEDTFIHILLTDLSFLNLRNYNFDEEALFADILNFASDCEPFMPQEFWDKITEWETKSKENPAQYPATALTIAAKRLIMRALYNANVIGGSGQITYINPKLRKDKEDDADDINEEGTLEV